MARWLLVGALGAETMPVGRKLTAPRPRSRRFIVGRARAAPGSTEVGVLTCGVGPEKAARRTEAVLRDWPADVVISFGTAGALSDELARGDLITADRLYAGVAPIRRLSPLPGLPAVALSTVRKAVWTRERRDILAQAGAQACEMEAAGVWDAVHHSTAPDQTVRFAVLKVISDLAGAEADPATPNPNGAQNPIAVARFLARAKMLVERHLLPALWSHIP